MPQSAEAPGDFGVQLPASGIKWPHFAQFSLIKPGGTTMQHALEPSEAEALKRCGGMLRFAAENKELPPEMVSTICAAWEARHENAWNQNIAKEFWLAFNSLCSLIKPVTMDTLSTNLREIPRPIWHFWNREPLSLSRRSARRYLTLLIALLCIAVILGFYTSTGANLITGINEQISTGNKIVEELVSQSGSLETSVSGKEFNEVGPDRQKDIALVQSKFQDLYYVLDQMAQKTSMLRVLMSAGMSEHIYTRGTLQPVKNLSEVRREILNYYDARRNAAEIVLSESVKISIVTSILPIFLGIMEACAYIVRLISEQIKETTFSTTSPVRHLVRLALGGLAGVVIGFGGIATVGSLSPSALAFLAGYAVEPVFATFDGIAAKFRS
jgi:hypothetical protein